MVASVIRFLHISDTHFGVHYAVKARNDLRRAYGNIFFEKIDQVLDKCENIDFILHSGDFFNRSSPHPDIIDRSVKKLLKIANKIPFFIIPGNHERSRLPFGLLLYHDNFNCFTRPSHFIFEKNGFRIKISGFPYVRDNIRANFQFIIKKAIKNNRSNCKKSDYHFSILLMHQLVQGSRIENYKFLAGRNIIPFNLMSISNFDYVATGHVHRFQFLYRDQLARINSIHLNHKIIQYIEKKRWKFDQNCLKSSWRKNPVIGYSGSLDRVSFQEKNELKGFIIGEIHFSSKEYKETTVSYTFYPLASIPMIHQIWDMNLQPLNYWIKQGIKIIHSVCSSKGSKNISAVYHIKIVGIDSRKTEKLQDLKKEARENKIYLTFS